jgi:hypothetical protein
MTINFPTIVVDNFLENPDKVRQLALSMQYSKSSGEYPGERTKHLGDVNRNLFNYLCSKFFSLNYDFMSPIKWNTTIYFQKIYPLSSNKFDITNMGWVHADYNKVMGAVLYLNPNIDLDTGTHICKPNDINFDIESMDKEQDVRIPYYRDNIKSDNYEENLIKNNSLFTDTVCVSNLYNRLIAFDGTTFHHANNLFSTNEEPRLICNIFVNTIEAAVPTPIERLNLCKMEDYGL